MPKGKPPPNIPIPETESNPPTSSMLIPTTDYLKRFRLIENIPPARPKPNSTKVHIPATRTETK